MNILVVGSDFSPRSWGIGAYTKELSTFLTKENQVTVLATGIPDAKAFDHGSRYRIIRTPSIPILRYIAFIIYVPWILRRHRIDAVLHVVWITSLISHMWYWLVPVPYFVSVHGTEIRDDKTSWRRRFKYYLKRWRFAALSKAKGIFPVSNYSASLVMSLGIEQSRIKVLLNGVNTEHFSPVTSLHKNAKQQKILTVARLDLNKGHDHVLKALVLLKEQGFTPNYTIVGQGPEEKRLRNMVQVLDLENQVVFTGFISDDKLPAIYTSCDIYVMASREIPGRLDLVEGFGISFLEAGASGLPVIAGDSGGISDAVKHGKTGLLVNPDEPEDIASAIKRLLNDDNLAKQLGSEGRRWAETQMSWEHAADRLVKAMQRMM